MLRLIACDIDGTLVTSENRALPPELFSLISDLNAHGVAFAACSGRQLNNLRHLFAPVDEYMYYLCENGSVCAQGGQVAKVTPIPDAWSREMIADLQGFSLNLLLSTPHYAYVLDANPAFVERIAGQLRNTVHVIRDCSEILGPLNKISGYSTDLNAMEATAKALGPKWGAKANAVLAGKHWFDITLTNKSHGIRWLCEQLHISPAEAAAFGDYYNDLPMLELVGHPYLMENAPNDLKRLGFTPCRSVPEVIRRLLAEIKEG